MNEASTILLGLLSLCALMLCLASVLTRHVLRAVVYLMGFLFIQAGFFLVLKAEFLAGIQVLIYVGGIVVMLIFAVMLTKSKYMEDDHPTMNRQILAGLGVLGFFLSAAYVITQSEFFDLLPAPVESSTENIKALGRAFLDRGARGFILPFELISILLLVVLITGIVIARKEKHF